MIDPALIDALSHALAPPAIIRSVYDLDGSVEAFAAKTNAEYEELTKYLDEWVARGRALREEMWARRTAEIDSEGSPEEVEILERIIAAVEERQAVAVQAAREDQRRWKNLIKRGFRISPHHGSFVRDIVSKFVALTERQHNERGDFLLFLRALRARFDPDARGGRVFDNPADLEKYLRRCDCPGRPGAQLSEAPERLAARSPEGRKGGTGQVRGRPVAPES